MNREPLNLWHGRLLPEKPRQLKGHRRRMSWVRGCIKILPVTKTWTNTSPCKGPCTILHHSLLCRSPRWKLTTPSCMKSPRKSNRHCHPVQRCPPHPQHTINEWWLSPNQCARNRVRNQRESEATRWNHTQHRITTSTYILPEAVCPVN